MRETKLMIATGMMGVGKSYLTERMIPEYMRKHKKRKVLVYDINNESTWEKHKTVLFDIEEVQRAKAKERKTNRRVVSPSEKRITQLPPGQVRRIAPFTRYGVPMNLEQKRLTFEVLLECFRGGLLFLEDINKYISSFQDDRVTGAFKAIRHNSQDIIMHMQSMQPVRPLLLEAASCFRMHYDGVDIDKIKSRLGSLYEVFKLAQIIIEEEYIYNDNKRFYCYVFHKERKLKGVKVKQFQNAAKKYLAQNPNIVKQYALEIAMKHNRLKASTSDNEKAIFNWLKEKEQFYLS